MSWHGASRNFNGLLPGDAPQSSSADKRQGMNQNHDPGDFFVFVFEFLRFSRRLQPPNARCRASPSHLHEQYLEDFLNLKAERDKVFLGNGLVGGVYTEPVAIV